MSHLQFESLQEHDILQLRDISEEFQDVELEGMKKFLSEKQNIALVAKLDDKVIGYLQGYALTDYDGHYTRFFIHSVDIHEEYQNKGYGSRFIQFAVDWARDNGFDETLVPTEKSNPRACRVYEKAGLKPSENDCDRIYEIKYTEEAN
jgi:GNAT superfamily N-acetyltransferase